MSTHAEALPPQPVLERYALEPGTLEPVPTGLINRSWIARRGPDRFVLQRMHAIFPPETQLDADRITRHLEARGLPTTRLVPDTSGALFYEYQGSIWRMLTFVEGVTRDALQNTAQAREAGRVLAEFHGAVAELDYLPQSARPNVHDLARHVENLRRALEIHSGHREHATVADLAGGLLDLAATLPALEPTPPRLVHGDPKISNIVFAGQGDEAICLIDLDTITRMPVVLELGDALRSWCNESAEDAPDPKFSIELFEAACAGYASSTNGLAQTEWQQIPVATLIISLELAIRFCTDALDESYFSWDTQRFDSRSHHNRIRAENQLALARQIAGRRDTLDSIVHRAFA